MEEQQRFFSACITNNFYSKQYSILDGSITCSKFEGVVKQQYGYWVAEAYVNYQLIWHGTFKSEKEAAMACDSLSSKFYGGDTNRNFALTNNTIQEPKFQNQLDMIKEGSYPTHFSGSFNAKVQESKNSAGMHGPAMANLKQLFQKKLTESDVFNRLNIPRKYAVEYFGDISTDAVKVDTYREFFDRVRTYKFRYRYYKSSNSFAFTSEWTKFAKKKQLRANDRVLFSQCFSEGKKMWIIDVTNSDGRVIMEGDRDGDVWPGNGIEKMNAKNEFEEGIELDEKKDILGNLPIKEEGKKSIRLFGTQIYYLD